MEYHGPDHSVVRYLKSVVDARMTNNDHDTHPHAQKSRREETVQYEHLVSALLENDVDKMSLVLTERLELLESRDANGWSILHEVARSGNLPFARVLVEKWNINLNMRTNSVDGNAEKGGSPLYYAQQQFHASTRTHPLVQYLIDSGGKSIAPGDVFQHDEL